MEKLKVEDPVSPEEWDYDKEKGKDGKRDPA